MVHETTAPVQVWACQQTRGGGWGVGRIQNTSHLDICNASMPSRCQLILPHLVCTQLRSLHDVRDYCTGATVGASTDTIYVLIDSISDQLLVYPLPIPAGH
jgi:hypothetical protein